MSFSFIQSWEPSKIIQSKLKTSDENEPPISSVVKTEAVVRNTLRSSSDEGTPVKCLPLKTSRENIPAAADPGAVMIPPEKFEGFRESTLKERFDQLKNLTKLMLSGIEYSDHEAINARFANVLCIESTRIGEAIHANKVKIYDCEVVCTQSPIDKSHNEFWKLARNALIVDLCNDEDRNPASNKNILKHTATPYYPVSKEQPLNLGSVKVELDHTENLSDVNHIRFSLYKYNLLMNDKQEKSVRINYSSWNDFDGISLPEVHRILDAIEKVMKDYGLDSLIVHCRGGVGRTGSLTICDAIRRKHKNGTLKAFVEKWGGPEKAIDHLILEGRRQRGYWFVSTEVQYQMVNDFLLDMLKKPTP